MGEYRYRWRDPKRDRAQGWRRHNIALGAMLAVAAVALALSALHAYGNSLENAARDTKRPFGERVKAAERARAIEPWYDRRYVTWTIARADQLMSEGYVDEAYFLLLPLTDEVRGDAQFRETYQRVLALKWPLDARKAHQQHAREATGGALAPEDVIK